MRWDLQLSGFLAFENLGFSDSSNSIVEIENFLQGFGNSQMGEIFFYKNFSNKTDLVICKLITSLKSALHEFSQAHMLGLA